MPKILHVFAYNIFSADELTTGEIPEMENMQQPPRFLLRACIFFLLLSLGVGAIEQLCHPYTQLYHVQFTHALSYDHYSVIERNSRNVTFFILQ